MKRMIVVFLCVIFAAAGLIGCAATDNTSASRQSDQVSNEESDLTESSSVGEQTSSECGDPTGQVPTDPDTTGTGSAVIYFSRTNNTEKIADYIVGLTDSDKYEIEAKMPYTDSDINYNDPSSRSTKEQNDPTARPEIGSGVIDLSKYEVIYLGYPIWWGQAPKIMYTFVESYDFSGKTIIPFCTSGSSGIGSSATNLSKSTAGAIWKDGRRFSASASKNDVESWINSIK